MLFPNKILGQPHISETLLTLLRYDAVPAATKTYIQKLQ